MKIICVIIFSLYSLNCFANEIDKLQTNKDVCKFIIKKVSSEFKGYCPLETNTPNTDTSTYSRNKFFKIDFDKNGLTDLIINGNKHLIIVFDNGKNGYSYHYLDKGEPFSNKSDLLMIDTVSIPKKIILKESGTAQNKIDTLIYKFNDFIEYNSTPIVDFVFNKIKIKTSQCFGTCPMFEMTINNKRNATYKAIKFNDETGDFYGKIPTEVFDELVSILKYIQIEKLNNSYSVNWTCDQTVTLEIEYNGKSKVIVDYGKQGTYGLSLLYSKFFQWRKTIEWSE